MIKFCYLNDLCFKKIMFYHLIWVRYFQEKKKHTKFTFYIGELLIADEEKILRLK